VPQAPWVGVGLFSFLFSLCCRGTTVGLQPGLVPSGVISTMASLQPWPVSSSCSTHAKHTVASLQPVYRQGWSYHMLKVLQLVTTTASYYYCTASYYYCLLPVCCTLYCTVISIFFVHSSYLTEAPCDNCRPQSSKPPLVTYKLQ